MSEPTPESTAARGADPPVPPALPADPRLRERLDRWTAQGLIDADQAARIAAAEAGWAGPGPAAPAAEPVPGPPTAPAPEPTAAAAEPTAAPATEPTAAPATEPTAAPATEPAAVPAAPAGAREPERARGAVVAEALGYVGGALAVIAAVLAFNELWRDAGTTAQITFAGIGALALLVAGLAVGTRWAEREPAAARLRGVLWVLSTVCLVAAQLLVGDHVWQWRAAENALAASAVGAGYGLLLWARSVTALQQLAVFVAVSGVVASGLDTLDAGRGTIGTALWLLSAGWAVAAYAGLLPPRRAGGGARRARAGLRRSARHGLAGR